MEVCKVCRNTGMRPLSTYLDCTDCNSAVERAAFNKWRETELNSIGTENDDWAIHQRALAMAPKQEAPAGWKLVPEDPTGDMFRAASKIDNEMFAGGSSHGAEDGQVWAAMYDAAPEAPVAAPAVDNGALTEEQVHQGVMALLGCTSSEVEDYSAKLYEGYANDVRRVHAALSGAKGN